MIRYFIPADGDDPSHPNVFQLPSGLVGSGSVRCADVEKHFPLPGRYHFRFKKKFRDAYVWVDMTDAGAVVPACDGVFTAKITRLSDGRGGGGSTGRNAGMAPQAPAGIVPPAVGVGSGLGGDDLLNMSHGPGASTIPGPGLMGGGSQPDDLLGMFDSSPSQGVPPPPASASPVTTGGGVGQPRPMARSPPMRASPMGGHMGHVGGGGGGGFGVASGGMGAHRPVGVPQWQQQQQQHPQHQQQQQQQQFARFPPQGRGNM